MHLLIDDVHVRFGRRPVLTGVDLVVEAGTITALMGPSGSGKSTLLTIVAGHLTPDRGSTRIVGAPPAGARIDWIVQSSPLLTRRRARENVALGAILTGTDPREAEESASRALEVLGIGHLADTPVHRLSGGERQRLAVARSIAVRSEVLLADEPTAPLDARSREAVTAALIAASRQGAIVLVATHDRSVAESCDAVVDLMTGTDEDGSTSGEASSA